MNKKTKKIKKWLNKCVTTWGFYTVFLNAIYRYLNILFLFIYFTKNCACQCVCCRATHHSPSSLQTFRKTPRARCSAAAADVLRARTPKRRLKQESVFYVWLLQEWTCVRLPVPAGEKVTVLRSAESPGPRGLVTNHQQTGRKISDDSIKPAKCVLLSWDCWRLTETSISINSLWVFVTSESMVPNSDLILVSTAY